MLQMTRQGALPSQIPRVALNAAMRQCQFREWMYVYVRMCVRVCACKLQKAAPFMCALAREKFIFICQRFGSPPE